MRKSNASINNVCCIQLTETQKRKEEIRCSIKENMLVNSRSTFYIILVYESEKPLKFQRFNWSEWRDSNSRLLRPERSALPAALHPEVFNCNKFIITPEVKMYIV